MNLDIIDVFTHHDILSQKSEPVDLSDPSLDSLIGNMIETMNKAKGIGLAAIQVGIPKRLFIIDIPKVTESVMVCINPILVVKSKDTAVGEEGCLSIPGFEFDVRRSKTVVLKYTNLKGEEIEKVASGILAVCIQHEYDHLEGIVYIDRVNNKEKKIVNSEFVKAGKNRYFI